MIDELRKYPFARPLIFWISGILLYALFQESLRWLFCLLLLLPMPLLFVRDKSRFPLYEARWVWGFLFSLLFILLSISVTRYADIRYFSFVHEKSALQLFAEEKRADLCRPIERLCLSEEEKSVLATITLGDKQSLSKDTRRKFTAAGVPHILAVSGFHVAAVCGFLSLLFSFFPHFRRYNLLRHSLMILLLWGYVIVTGLAPSAIRAALMLSFYLFGKILDRTSINYNTLFASAFCMLAFNPLYLFDIGFELSYIAVLSIFFFMPRLNGLLQLRNPIVKYFWSMITLTVAAQIGTTWLCLYYFGRFSSVFLFTNLPVTLIATLLIPVFLIWILLSPVPMVSGWMQPLIERLVHGMMQTVDLFSALPGASLQYEISFPMLLAGYATLISMALFIAYQRKTYLFSTLILSLFVPLMIIVERFRLC